METDVINFLLNSNITLLFAGIVLYWGVVRRIDSMCDSLESEISSLKDEINTKFEKATEKLHECEMRKQVEHAKMKLTINKILWYLEGNSKRIF